MTKPSDSDSSASGQRLQKVLAAAGLGSRRDCEELIRQGRVEVDRQVITELGTRVDPTAQEIRVDGEALRRPKPLYFVVNKPVGVVTTNFDPSGRSRVIDLVPTEERVFAVGRLDRSSEGLILVTNDGEFANRLTHPRYGVEKTYLVRVAGAPDQRQLARLKRGLHLAEGFAKAQSIIVKKQHGQSTDMVIVLNEGRNREIRRILARVGHKVLTLKRVAVGNVKLGDLPSGGWRRLMPEEIAGLLHLAKETQRAGKPRKVIAGASQVQGPKSKMKRGRPDEDSTGPYIQKQALLTQPLSLEDLLSDDMDEGPLVGGNDADDSAMVDRGASRGGVIDYEDSAPADQPKNSGRRGDRSPRAHPSPPGKRPADRANRPPSRPKRPAGDGRNQNRNRTGNRAEAAGRPREDFGKKRGGKRTFGAPVEVRGAAGDKAGKFGFRPKRKKPKAKVQDGDNQRRGERRGGQGSKKAGNRGGKRKGRR